MEPCCRPGLCTLYEGRPEPDAGIDRKALAPPPAPAGPLDEREANVLLELAREGDAHVTFAGLKRRMGLHQQVLTRTLRRLESQGLVLRDEKGYHPTERGFAASSTIPARAPSHEVLTVVQALLPPDAAPDVVAARLARRWFQGLRWYGQSDAPGETTLTWLTDPEGGRVRVRVSGGALTVDAEVAQGAPERTFRAMRPILASVAELYGLGEATPGARAGARDLRAS